MLGEEYLDIAGSAQNLSTPSAPTCFVRSAQSNETALNTGITAIYVAATNYYGTTAISGSTSVSVGSGQVVDVTISPVTGAMQYQIWGSGSGSYYLLATCGGVKYTLQNTTLPAASTQPTTDSGTGKPTRYEGVIPVISGLSQAGDVYPSGWQGGYYNNAVGTHLSYSVCYTVCEQLWDGNGSISPGAFKGDPAEIVSSGTDLANLSQDVISTGTGTNYELFIQQSQVTGVTVGNAVSAFANPVTKSTMKTVVHPFYLQGNATFLSYQLPQSWTNVANAWEFSAPQDYVSIAWPGIDVTWRYSLLLYGALVAHAPQYSAHLSGLQRSDSTPYS